MQKTTVSLILVILLLGLLAACGGGNNAANQPAAPAEDAPPAAPAPAVEPTSAPPAAAEPAAAEPAATEPVATEPAAAEPADAETSVISVADLGVSLLNNQSDFNTYYYVFNISMSDSTQENAQVITADVKFSVEPPASSFTMNMTGFEEGLDELGQISVVQIGDTTYTLFPGLGCFSMPAGMDDPFSDFNDSFSPNSVLEELDVSQVRRVRPNETINGIEVQHYVFDEALLNSSRDEERQYDSAEGHLYLAEDGGYLVRMVMEISGSGLDLFGDMGEEADEEADEGAQQTMSFTYELVSINEPLDIAIPAECAEAASSADYPLLADAYEVSSFAGFITYRSDATLAEAIAFYDEELAALGYDKNEASSFVSSGSAILAYTQDGKTLSLIINEEDAGGISVTITSD